MRKYKIFKSGLNRVNEGFYCLFFNKDDDVLKTEGGKKDPVIKYTYALKFVENQSNLISTDNFYYCVEHFYSCHLGICG